MIVSRTIEDPASVLDEANELADLHRAHRNSAGILTNRSASIGARGPAGDIACALPGRRGACLARIGLDAPRPTPDTRHPTPDTRPCVDPAI